MALMIPFVVIAEKRRKMKPVFLAAIMALGLSQLGFFALQQSLAGLALSLLLFFTAFNLLEATLPSLVSKMAPVESKGTIADGLDVPGAIMGHGILSAIRQSGGTAVAVANVDAHVSVPAVTVTEPGRMSATSPFSR